MSFSALNYPPLITAAGAAVLIGESLISLSGLSLVTLKVINVVSFVINVVSVSIPGRIDQQLVEEMRRDRNNDTPSESLLPDNNNNGEDNYSSIYAPKKGRSMVAPAQWAFAIWAIIYLGETSFCVAQFFAQDATFQALIPSITVFFVAANLMQSLWCASFRPSYKGWSKYVSVLMLGGTAYSLYHLQTALTSQQSVVSMIFITPSLIRFGWTTAATLVNINGSIAMEERVSDTVVIALGHFSAVLATAIGITVTLIVSSPAYGFTLAWALAACASGMKPRAEDSTSLAKARTIQRGLCWTGSALCIAAAVYATGVFTA